MELSTLSIRELRNLLLSKQLSPVELTQKFLSHIETQNRKLNAFIQITSDEALKAARIAEEAIMKDETTDPLLGIPITIMDNHSLKGYPTTIGSLLFKECVASEDSLLVTRLKESGAIILGKTNLPEFGLYPSTQNRLGPPCCNPWNTSYTAGGSSGGAAAAVAAGLTPFALATDVQGGIRQPSSYCGVFGLKPTRGKIPLVRQHVIPPAEKTLYQEGIIARSSADAGILLEILAKSDPRDHESYYAAMTPKEEVHSLSTKLRVGYSVDLGFIPLDPEVGKIVKDGLNKLQEAGHSITEINLPLDQEMLFQYCDAIATDKYLCGLACKKNRPDLFQQCTDYAKWWMERATQVSGLRYSAAFLMFSWVKEMIDRALEEFDILITPTTPTTAFPLSEIPVKVAEKPVDPHVGMWAFTIPFNISGHPAANIPCGITQQGLPVGFQVIGKPFEEEILLRLACQCESILPMRNILLPE